MNLLFVFISPILDSLSDNENKEKLEKKWLKVFAITLIVSKIITYYINKYEIDSKLMLDFINGNLKFIFNKGENPIISLVEIVVNISQSLEIYLGVISVLVAIYIYSISLGDDFKKYVLLTLLGEGKALYLTIFILVLYFFNISPTLFITLNVVIFYELYRMIRETFKIMNTVYFKENWKDKIIPELKKEKNRKNLENIYYELRKRINKAIIDKEFVVLGDMIFYYETLLMTDGFEVPIDSLMRNKSKKNRDKNEKEEDEATIFLYDIYDYLIENKDKNIFHIISRFNIRLGRYYLIEKEDFRKAEDYFDILTKKYEYYEKNYEDNILNIGEELFIGFKFYKDSEKITEDKEIIILRAILNLFMKLLKEKKYKELKVYQEILGTESGIEETLLKVYVRIVLIYFLEKENNEESNELLNKLKDYFSFNKLNILQELYEKNKSERLESKFKLISYTCGRRNIFGLSSGELEVNCINDTILKLLNENAVYYIKEEFILNNLYDIESRIHRLKLKRLQKRLDMLDEKIRLKKAKDISLSQISNEKLEEYYKEIKENEMSSFVSFLKEKTLIKIKSKYLEEVDWKNLSKGYKEVYKNEILDDLRKDIILSHIGYLDEYLFVENIKNKKKLISETELKQYLNNKNDYLVFSDWKHIDLLLEEELDIFYFEEGILSNIMLINKKSIKEIIFYLPEGYDRLKYTYVEIESLKDNKDEKILEIIEGKTQEEKELIRQGSSLLKVAKRMEIVFNDEVEIYEISNEKLKDEER